MGLSQENQNSPRRGDTEPQSHPVGSSRSPQPVDAAPLEMMPPEEESPAGGGEGDQDSGFVVLQALKSGSTRKVRHGGRGLWVGVGWQSTQLVLSGTGCPCLVHRDGGPCGW